MNVIGFLQARRDFLTAAYLRALDSGRQSLAETLRREIRATDCMMELANLERGES